MKQRVKEELIEDIEELSKLFTDKISELHKVQGAQTQRHSFILYRKLLNNISWKLQDEK